MDSSPTQAISRTAALLAFALAATGVAAVPASSAPTSRVVVTSLTGDVAAAARAVQTAGGRVIDRLSLIGGVSASLPTGSVLAPSFRVVANSSLTVAGTKDDAAASVAVGVRTALGLGAPRNEGAGVTVAVVDTGVADVPDLAGRVKHVGGGAGHDDYGHGTFVAGLIAGNGASSEGRPYAGVAPAASILDVKVADASGSTDLVTVLQGLQAVAADGTVDVVNLSLSSGSPLPYQIDPLSAALEGLWRRGITVVVPAGNDGPREGTIASPGNDPVLLTAGGLDSHGTAARGDDTVADWSGRGPAPQGVQKPDLVAPGAHVVSLRAPNSAIARDNQGGIVDANYFKGSGTSFSTAATAGAVAALLSRRRNLSPDQVKQVLTDSAQDGKALKDKDAAGAGALDVTGAYDQKAKKDNKKNDEPDVAPGDPALWAAFLDALLRGDENAAASSWSKLSQAARNWAASSWSKLDPEARNWAARNWAARNWAGGVEVWAARNWAARNWAARNWANSDWSASSWSAGNWAASSWSARNWAAGNWATSDWSAGNWSAGNWAAGNWSARNWSAGNWAAGNWAASSWSARNWSAINWS